MNSLNLRQIDGGNVIKQADFGSNLSFELLDERRRKIPELDGQTATIRLIKGDNIVYQTEQQVVDGTVSFKFDRVLEKGIYVLEIVAGNYVFPSNNMVKITIEKTAGNYKPENMVKTDLVELQGKITAIEQREHDVNQELLDVGQKQAEMTKRIEILESREDHDTIYDDTEIKNRLVALEQKQDNDTIYDDTPIIKRIEKLESKEDSDTIYDDSELVSRVTALENKPDKDTIYNDAQLKEEISKTKSKVDSLSEKVSSLESKQDHDTIYDDTEIKQSIANVDTKVSGLSEKVTALEERPIVDTALTERVEALERKEDRDTVYDDSAIVKRIETLEAREDKDTIYNDTEIKNRLVALEQKEDKDTVYDDRKLVERIESLEAREDKDTIYDDSDLKHRVTELENRPVAEPYNDTEIKNRLVALEQKQDNDTIYDDTDIKERISALEEKPDKDTIYDDTNLKARIVELETALNTLVRKRPPMSFYIDRSDMSKMKAVFDNGCVMINFAGAVYNYFYGYPGGHDGRSFHYSNLPGNLIKVSVGIVGVDSLKEESISNAIYYCNNTKILNPIYDSSQFNFDELVIREPTDKIDYKLACQRNFVKIAYEIGALTESEIIKLGATKK